MDSEEYRREETSRAKDIKDKLIEQLQEHVPDTLGNLEACLRGGLKDIEIAKERIMVLAKPLP